MAEFFDAFISYRRSDGASFARRLRRALREFHPPKSIRGSSAPLKIYLDTMYERATKDFYEGVTRPALVGSRYLIVVATPDAADRGSGSPDWMRREIDDFEAGPNAGNVMAVLAKDLMGAPLPGDLARRYPNVELIDLRGLSVFSFFNPLKATRLTDELVKLVAPLLRLTSEEMPVLRREEERRQQTRLGLAAGGTSATIAAVAALSVWAINSRNNALDAISRSLFASDRVIQSVAGSMAPGETRSNLMATTCDLLDSLGDGAVRDARTNALVLCAVERSESRDRQNEPADAARILDGALAVAERQYGRSKSPDDALAVIEARRAVMGRSLAKADPESVLKETEFFIGSARRLSQELPSETSLLGTAADALQTQAVGLAEKELLPAAIVAVDAAINMRKLALERAYGPGAALEAVATVALKAQIHARSKQPDESARAIERAGALFAAIDRDAVSKQGLEQRYREVGDLIGGNPAGKP